MRFGSGPMTFRFAAYQRRHSWATCWRVACGPRCRAAMVQRLSPRTTVRLRAPDDGDGVCGAGPSGPRADGVRVSLAGVGADAVVVVAEGEGADVVTGVVRTPAPKPGSGTVATG